MRRHLRVGKWRWIQWRNLYNMSRLRHMCRWLWPPLRLVISRLRQKSRIIIILDFLRALAPITLLMLRWNRSFPYDKAHIIRVQQFAVLLTREDLLSILAASLMCWGELESLREVILILTGVSGMLASVRLLSWSEFQNKLKFRLVIVLGVVKDVVDLSCWFIDRGVRFEVSVRVDWLVGVIVHSFSLVVRRCCVVSLLLQTGGVLVFCDLLFDEREGINWWDRSKGGTYHVSILVQKLQTVSLVAFVDWFELFSWMGKVIRSIVYFSRLGNRDEF